MLWGFQFVHGVLAHRFRSAHFEVVYHDQRRNAGHVFARYLVVDRNVFHLPDVSAMDDFLGVVQRDQFACFVAGEVRLLMVVDLRVVDGAAHGLRSEGCVDCLRTNDTPCIACLIVRVLYFR